MKFRNDEEARAWDLYVAHIFQLGAGSLFGAEGSAAKADQMLEERRKRENLTACILCGSLSPDGGFFWPTAAPRCVDVVGCADRRAKADAP